MTSLTPTAVWRISTELVLAIEERLGDPVDSYVNGSQTWILEHDGVSFEWRLHPVAEYVGPRGLSPYELWEQVTGGLGAGSDGSALPLGQETRSLQSLWDGLECFPAHDAAVEPARLAEIARGALGVAPDRYGLVDHGRVGDEWERTRGHVSIIELLLAQLEPSGRP